MSLESGDDGDIQIVMKWLHRVSQLRHGGERRPSPRAPRVPFALRVNCLKLN